MSGIFRAYYRHFRFAHADASVWVAENPVLFEGELGYESDTLLAKLGDGYTAWNDLDYWPVGGSGSGGGDDTYSWFLS